MFSFRDYQLEAIETARSRMRSGERAVLFHIATGAGKTVTAAGLIVQLVEINADFRTLVCVPKISIIKSFVRDVTRVTGITPTIACAAMGEPDTSGQIVVGSIQTLSKRHLSGFHLIVADECHRVMDDGGQYRSIIDKLPEAKVLGLTATPFRSGTGYIYGKEKLFGDVAFHRGLEWTTVNGFTVKAVLKASRSESFDTSELTTVGGDWSPGDLDELAKDHAKTRRQIASALEKLVGRKKVIWAAINIAHAESILQELQWVGERATIVTSTTDERDANLGAFEEDAACRHLVFVTIVAEGFDFAPIDAIVLLRPTKSASLYVQMVGRCLRPWSGKANALVIDYGDVIRNCGPLDRPFVLDPEMKKTAQHEANAELVVHCSQCGSMYFKPVGAETPPCPDCGFLKPLADNRKNLHDIADEDSVLYTSDKERSTDGVLVEDVLYSPSGSTEEARRQTKVITLNGKHKFFIKNPAFTPPVANGRFIKASRIKKEEQMDKFLRACGLDVDIRSTLRQQLKPKNRVLVDIKYRGEWAQIESWHIVTSDEGVKDPARLHGMADQERLVHLPDTHTGGLFEW